ncbi:thioredoxin family protein [Epibacterium sp. MM17-32]|uniref:thioredoxin family protein n=1 Tax=Epibacterium sp. MM17-32 TaxID=2917734 RepID=UPI001EF65F3B|nr:thioredoxin family protein [Epibacterium sp. MM17-32]MCG7628974.1 thioredoxin family protein [Epibacterium sp. MM17-32]
MKLLKFEAEWCGPCKALDKELDKLREEVELVRINIEEDHGVARLHNIRAVPTMVLLKDDVEIGRLSGRHTAAQIDRFIRDAA